MRNQRQLISEVRLRVRGIGKEITSQQNPKWINSHRNAHYYAFKLFDITNEDIRLGLRQIKIKVDKRFRELVKQYHPDIANNIDKPGPKIKDAWQFKQLSKARKRILNLKVMPVTIDNMEAVYEITKGYKGTSDYELPFEI